MVAQSFLAHLNFEFGLKTTTTSRKVSVYGRYKNDILLHLKPRQKLLNLLTYPKSTHPADIKFIHQTGADRCLRF